ncbi:hypothetical protein CF326_g5000 [Tilletia indica]|uniref:Protein kinase domain-containing protein n=1 Tax=Tilletia indica TaxID=43049 RepID=A0A177TDU3_9BASI|nr:hypothetical protein CF326_g5000 [Tilletia indica]KAE8241396.1 hypothetical protein A4X13_0g7432 [Tilletia indica]
MPPIDKAALRTSHPFEEHTAQRAAYLLRQGKRLYWPTAPYNFDNVYGRLFGSATAPGSILLLSSMRSAPSSSPASVDTRGAGPYGPAGELWISAAVFKRARTIGFDIARIEAILSILIPKLAILLLALDSGDTVEQAGSAFNDSYAYGRLAFPVTLGVLDAVSQLLSPSQLLQLAEAANTRAQQGAHQTLESKLQAQEEKIKRLEDDSARLAEEVRVHKAASLQKDDDNVRLAGEVEILRVSSLEKEELISAATRTNELQEERIGVLKTLRAEDEKRTSTLRSELAQVATDKERLQAEHNRLQTSNATLGHQIVRLRQEAADLQGQAGELRSSNSALESQVSKLKDEVNKLHQENANAQAFLDVSDEVPDQQLEGHGSFLAQPSDGDTAMENASQREEEEDDASIYRDLSTFWRDKAKTLEAQIELQNRLQQIDPLRAPALNGTQAPPPSLSVSSAGTRMPQLPTPTNIHHAVFGWPQPLLPSSQMFSWVRGPGRYVDYSLMGSGVHGRVWKAQDGLVRRPVAAKTVGADRHMVFPNSAWREVAALRQVRHPNVVEMLDVVLTHCNGVPEMQIVLDFCNTDLHQVLTHPGSRAKLSAPTVRFLSSQIAQGLEAIHSANLTHFDLKPSNILISSNGVPRIADFGLAEDSSQPNPRVRTRPVSSLFYRAPEVLMRSLELGPAVDVWSFGVVLAQMLEPNGTVLWPTAQPNLLLGFQATDIMWQHGELWPGSDKLPGALENDGIPYNAPLVGHKRFYPYRLRDGRTTGIDVRLRQMSAYGRPLALVAERALTLNPTRRPTIRELITMQQGLGRKMLSEDLPEFRERHTQA